MRPHFGSNLAEADKKGIYWHFRSEKGLAAAKALIALCKSEAASPGNTELNDFLILFLHCLGMLPKGRRAFFVKGCAAIATEKVTALVSEQDAETLKLLQHCDDAWPWLLNFQQFRKLNLPEVTDHFGRAALTKQRGRKRLSESFETKLANQLVYAVYLDVIEAQASTFPQKSPSVRAVRNLPPFSRESAPVWWPHAHRILIKRFSGFENIPNFARYWNSKALAKLDEGLKPAAVRDAIIKAIKQAFHCLAPDDSERIDSREMYPMNGHTPPATVAT